MRRAPCLRSPPRSSRGEGAQAPCTLICRVRKKREEMMSRSAGCLALALVMAAAAPPAAQARVTRLEILRTEPFAGGEAFGTVGAYEKVVGRFHGELDPALPLNSVIVDLDKAPRNAAGRVEYTSDFYILRPADLAK